MSSPTVGSVQTVSARLLWSILGLVALLGIIYCLFTGPNFRAIPVVLVFGALGAFVSLQRSLKTLSEEDLQLMRQSWTYTSLPPLAGAVLAGILYLLFIAGLLQGALFPVIDPAPSSAENVSGVRKLFEVQAVGAADYAKLFFWSFVAGYSERFVTNIIGRFEATVESEDR